jgi:cell division control protein 45
LDRFEFTSFTRVTGYQSMLSASDASYAVTALLEYETPNELPSGSDDDPTSIIDQENKAGVEAFNNAYDALGTHSSEPMGGLMNGMNNEGYDASNLVNGGNLSSTIGIGAGLRRAMALQKSIIHTAVGLSERGSIALLRHFRYAHVTSTSVGENQIIGTDLIRSKSSKNNTGNTDKRDHIFSKPLALTRLAHFLMNMNRENGKWTGTKARPLVLIADKPRNKTCLIVGYEYPERAGDFVKNTFGPMFKQTAESMNGMFKFDSFDSNVVEVDAADVQRFMEQLHYLLDSV